MTQGTADPGLLRERPRCRKGSIQNANDLLKVLVGVGQQMTMQGTNNIARALPHAKEASRAI